ncbi:hypothetical protein Lalb_Chr11g0070721 [Lupinus albus]|uniref:Uncharacterized protein n=1 Tax=Lupinus albus TaxID=3870 RepID=A0A6A4PS71_LUPAL|nr:hypothetical protein Lalb_Chr11g0070721 [Lupinus albus]
MVIDEHSATTPTKLEHASKKTKVVKSKHKENKSWSKSSNKESSGEVVSKTNNYCAHLMKYIHKLPIDSIIIIVANNEGKTYISTSSNL